MNWRSIFLYNVLPRKRMFIAFIGFLISSTIITGGGILLTSIVNSTTSYLGESEDVLVISNPAASTPYTSVLPLELAETIKSIYGVVDVSPEVMTAAVYKNKAVYFRGVDIKEFFEFTDVNYLEGTPLSENDTYDVSVGINYAERNNLEIGDLMTIFSTRSDAAIELRVKSIFVTHTLLDDEIIAPLWIGQFFTFETFNYITHIRVKIDLEKIPDKEIIRELVASQYELTTIINIPSGAIELNATIYIRTGKGSEINESIILNDYVISFTLPYGEYEIQAEINGILSDPDKFILDKNTIKTIFVDYRERDVIFHVITDEDEPIQDVKITVYNNDEGLRLIGRYTYQAYSNSNGYATLTVGNGSYTAEFYYGVYWKSINFVTQEVNNYEIQLISRHPQINVKSPLNFSTIIGNELNISLSATRGYSIFFYPDDDIGKIQEYYYSAEHVSPPESMLIPFDIGFHSLSILVYNKDYLQDYDKSKNYAETKLFFTILNEFPEEFGFLNAMNGSQVYPSTILELNDTLSFNQGLLYRWNNEGWSEVEEDFLVSPIQTGIHSLQLRAEVTNSSKIWTYYFIVTNEPYNIGILNLPMGLRFKENDVIQTWFNPTFPIIEYRWDSDLYTPIDNSGKIVVQGLSEGNHTLSLKGDSGTLERFRYYDIEVDNTPANISLSESNNSIIESGSVLTYSLNETAKFVLFSWDNQDFSTSFEKLIPVSVENGNHQLCIITADLAGNVLQTNYTYNVINFVGTTAIDFYLQSEYSGLLNQSFIDLRLFSNSLPFKVDYVLTGPSSLSFSRTNLESERLHLYPGTYSLSISYFISLFDSRTRFFSFQICDGQNRTEVNGHALNESYNGNILVTIQAFDVSFTINEISNITLTDNIYYITYVLTTFPGVIYNTHFIIDTELPELTILSPNKGEEDTDVWLIIDSDAVEVSFKLEHDHRIIPYNNSVVLLEYNQDGMQVITFFLVDTFQNTRTVSYMFYNSLDYVPIELEFQVFLLGNDFNVSNLEVDISSSLNSTLWTGTTNFYGKLYLNLFPGDFSVQFEYSGVKYNFLLSTADGLNQTIYLGHSQVSFTILDNYAGSLMRNQFCTVRDLSGNRITTFTTDSFGQASSSIPAGDYIIYFTRSYEDISFPFQVYSPEQQIIFEIPSARQIVQFDFVYDTGSNVYNLDVSFQTIADGIISLSTGLHSSISLWISYGILNISYIQLSGEYVTLTRSFEPGREIITITVESDADSPWSKIPFKPITGFTFIISVSLEYMDYYLKGTLLFTYTLAYTEIILILIVVIVNMYTILQNMYEESNRETRILRMIGGTNTNALMTIFSRLGIIAIISSFMGYGIGLGILNILSSANQTVFFGHTFSPSGGWLIFLLNGVLTFFIGLVATLFITRNAKKEKRIVYSKR
ncbi:MAG: FtsX-like permease family protein [Candidatus Heimdallarchaeota archaeon]|nr:FtsX-like permease family protein [Candidatus Heimdallarchaeota archaeon]